jgi:membrane-bound lytic murein transglycosylase A
MALRPRLQASIVGWLAASGVAADPLQLADSALEPIQWSGIAGWADDNHLAAFAAYQTSCQVLRKQVLRKQDLPREDLPREDLRKQDLLKAARAHEHGPIYSALWELCWRSRTQRPQDAAAARAFFEQNFTPVRIARLGEVEGFLTGYYEPIVQGSRSPNPEFHVPLYRRPSDLLVGGHKPGSNEIPNKNASIGRRDEENRLVPYYDRGAIEAGALDGQKLEICWLKDPFDALAIQIEGSARVILEDGTPLRIGYDSHNGYSYSSIGRVLVERKLVPREEMSMQRIRDWMAVHPDEAPQIRATNRAYIFFRITGLSNDGEPVGAQGVPLTPGRSIAVDRLHEYGIPFFIEAALPIESAKPASPFRRLMIAQDTGSAIVGPARADLYWGSGDDAARIAGRIRHPGRFVMLLPRELDMVAAGKEMPLPVPKRKIPEAEAKKDNGKKDAGRTRPAARTAEDEGRPAQRARRQAIRVRWRYW